jgi:methionine-gamma-lyase
MSKHEHLTLDTTAIHADRDLNETSAVAPPIWQTSTFRGRSAEEFLLMATEPRADHFYTRDGNPTSTQAATVIAALEGAETAMMAASGMGAISSTVLTFVGAGDHVVAQRVHYAGTANLLRSFLPRMGATVTLVDQIDSAAFADAMRPETKLVMLETPSNPLLRLTDLRAVAEAARARGIVTVCDNTFATPINQRPIELGVDLVVHSGTKYFGGHSDLIAGVVAGGAEAIRRVWETSVTLGPTLGPFDAWLLLRGLRTLALRVDRQNRNALAAARLFEEHPAVSAVHYPGLESHPQHALARAQMSGFGGVLSIELEAGSEAAERFIAALRLAVRAASLGGVETLAVRPAAMWAGSVPEERLRESGITPGLVRIAIGVEGERDLLADFERGLEAAGRR